MSASPPVRGNLSISVSIRLRINGSWPEIRSGLIGGPKKRVASRRSRSWLGGSWEMNGSGSVMVIAASPGSVRLCGFELTRGSCSRATTSS